MDVIQIKWGNPEISDYDLILDYFSGMKINSIKTSSVPLAQYWQPTRKRIEQLSALINERLNNVELYFEYPTKSLGRSRASMSDAMIITPNLKIAIEAKYTEYKKTKYPLIIQWLNEKNIEHRKQVLDHWRNIISPYVIRDLDENAINSIPYQFFHRTASACFNNPQKAYVVYQLFWDEDTQSELEKFIDQINESKEALRANENLKFIIQKIKIKKINHCEMQDVFQTIKTMSVYEFDE